MIKNILRELVELSRFKKQLIMLFLDSVLLISALLISFSIRLGYWYWPENNLIFILIFSSPIIAIPIFFTFGIYQSILRYIGFKSLWSILQAVSFYALAWGVSGFMILGTDQGIPRSVILINWLLVLLSTVGVRVIARWILINNSSIDAKNVVIYGAGSAGRQLSIALMESNEYNPVAFIDDNTSLEGQSINEVKVFTPSKLETLINKNKVTEILLAIPSASQKRRKKIIDFLESFPLMVRSLPGVTELAQGKVSVNDLRVININDLLGRNRVNPNKNLMSLNVKDKVVMITGAGGSIGSELCRQILVLKPKIIVMYEMSEFALYEIDRELSGQSSQSDVKLIPILGTVTDCQRLLAVFKKYHVQTLYHAAAYKHVPLVEYNNSEGVKNNIFGTLNCAKSAVDSNVETFVLVSTDKAVRPTNTMGATKRFSEMILQALSLEGTNTRFSMVRFGNVLGSSGSVIPKFTKQIQNGGPLTITDKEMIRYFMTIPEAVELVIQAGAMGKGGDVFVLDMGKPVKILDLAIKMIHLSGLQVKNDKNPDGDIEIEFTGIRPGEKLYEELIIGNNIYKTDNPMIMSAQENLLEWHEIDRILGLLEKATENNDYQEIRDLLIQAIPEFKPNQGISDLLFSKK